MPTLAFPTGIYPPSSVNWKPRSNSLTFRSPLDGTVQTLELPGTVWTATVSWNTLPTAQWRVLQAFIAQLRGAAGRFYYGPPHATTRQATGSIGTPVVQAAGQTGNALAIQGSGASQTIFLAGDFIAYDTAVGRQLHVITANVLTNGSGQSSLPIEPPIRVSPAAGAAIIHNSPTCVMRLIDDDVGDMAIRPGPLAALTLDMIEAFA